MVLEGFWTVGGLAGLAALTAASITDLKTREVPDWVSYSLLFFAVGNALLLTTIRNDNIYIINSSIGLALGVGIGMLMFYTGQWGGGDSKLIMGLSALMGFAALGLRSPNGNMLIVFLVSTLFVGALYGIGYSFFMAITHFKACKAAALDILRSKNIFMARIVLIVLVAASFIYYMTSGSQGSIILLGLSLMLFLVLYTWVLVTTVEKVCMIRLIPAAKVTEGDWIVEPVMKGKKVIVGTSKTGVTIDELEKIKRSGVETVKIKIGIPFVPSFLIAYIITFAVSNFTVFW